MKRIHYLCQDVVSDAAKPFTRSVPERIKMLCLRRKNAVSGRKKCCAWEEETVWCVCRRVRELHFVDITDVEQLLDVMGQDVPQVAERVQRLLLPSYFPGACHCRAVCAALTQGVTEGMKHMCWAVFGAGFVL